MVDQIPQDQVVMGSNLVWFWPFFLFQSSQSCYLEPWKRAPPPNKLLCLNLSTMFASGDSDLETSQEVSEEVLKASITKDDRRMSRRMSSISGIDLGQLRFLNNPIFLVAVKNAKTAAALLLSQQSVLQKVPVLCRSTDVGLNHERDMSSLSLSLSLFLIMPWCNVVG